MKQTSSTLLYGYHPVCEALRARRRSIRTLYLAQGKGVARRIDVAELAARNGIKVVWETAQKLTERVGHPRHQDVAADASAYPVCTLEDILNAGNADENPPLILLLDQIVDPQNFGAIVRTALCAGIQGVVVSKDNSAPPSPAASKASAGALEHMRIAYETNLSNTIKILKDQGFWIAATDMGGQQTVFEADLKGALAIVIGSEEKGVRPLVKRHCDFTIGIPQTGPVSSLNASAAAAVVIYEAYRQRSGDLKVNAQKKKDRS